ncbi:B3/B4 domain-containing protein [Halalkalibacter alkalisediminis]|uniref:B3/4 domain-containing protein n=1 Tax=Halalkalibacter alkalisediminis TaxID=935616 RepID=A0ABV6NQ60_9BACI|nr:phenylalanine--tRNA ligase beta subunit-related protein [Halalkalibacter alkalisediminis]
MYPVISMSHEVEQKLEGVQVYAINLDLDPLDEDNSQVSYEKDWHALHEVWQGKTKAEVVQTERITAYRNFYKLLGFNTKKTLPSVQNLIQRFLMKEKLDRIPVIHPIVDAVNIAAVKTLIPLGVFDANCVEGEISLTLSRGGETFQPLGYKEPEELAADVLVLADDQKVLSQFCYRDSEAQKIRERTRSIWLLGCQVPCVSNEAVYQALDEAQEQLKRVYKLTKR